MKDNLTQVSDMLNHAVLHDFLVDAIKSHDDTESHPWLSDTAALASTASFASSGSVQKQSTASHSSPASSCVFLMCSLLPRVESYQTVVASFKLTIKPLTIKL